MSADDSRATNWVDKVASNNIWLTPPEALAPVLAYTGPDGIGLDPCTESSNPSDAEHFFTEDDDGLTQDWRGKGVVFVNPPYSLTADDKAGGQTIPPIRLWAEKIHLEARRGVVILSLLPCGARFSTKYWQQHVLTNELRAVCFWRGRIKFVNGTTGLTGKGNNYDSMFYGFNVDVERFTAAFVDCGAVFAMSKQRPNALHGFI